MYDFNQPVLSVYNPYMKGGKRRSIRNRTRRHKKSRSRRTRRSYR